MTDAQPTPIPGDPAAVLRNLCDDVEQSRAMLRRWAVTLDTEDGPSVWDALANAEKEADGFEEPVLEIEDMREFLDTLLSTWTVTGALVTIDDPDREGIKAYAIGDAITG